MASALSPAPHALGRVSFFAGLAAAICMIAAAQAALPQPSVSTGLGSILGSYCAATNNSVVKFIGIPYAQAPVGPLRWKAPAKYVTPYPAGGLSATTPRPYCPQIQGDNSFWKATVQSEDCLYINVWAPASETTGCKTPRPSKAPPKLLPVRVYIHGGTFATGGGIDPAYDGCQVVADGNVLTVTMSYRLGVLGYLALPYLHDEAAGNTTGNWGILDQQLALRWVQENIAAFGGDPKRVMIHGQSAGGSSVYFHTLLPGSRGLFSRAIIESGAYDFSPMFLKDAYTAGEFILNHIGCNASSATARGFASSKACLFATNASILLGAQDELEAIVYLASAIDGSQQGFPAHPDVMIQQGYLAHVPMLIGTNTNEGSLFPYVWGYRAGIAPPAWDVTIFQMYMKGFGLVPDSFMDQVTSTYNVTWYGGSYFYAAINATADFAFWCPLRRSAVQIAPRTQLHAYYMHLVTPTSGCGVAQETNITGEPQAALKVLGAVHTYELPFVFNLPYADAEINQGCVYTPNEKEMASFMCGVWSAFTSSLGTLLPPKTKRLTAPQLLSLKTWPRWTRGSPLAMNLNFDRPDTIDLNAQLVERCQVWDDIMAAAVQTGTRFPDWYTPAAPPPSTPTAPPPPPKASWGRRSGSRLL